MLLNANDIFKQIGLVVDPKSPRESSQEELNYSVYLEIELSEGKHELLEIRYKCIDMLGAMMSRIRLLLSFAEGIN
jgi:hypothetical protein